MKIVTTTIAALSTALVLATSAGAMTTQANFENPREAALGELGSITSGTMDIVASSTFNDARSQALNSASTTNTYAFASNSADITPSAAGYGAKHR